MDKNSIFFKLIFKMLGVINAWLELIKYKGNTIVQEDKVAGEHLRKQNYV